MVKIIKKTEANFTLQENFYQRGAAGAISFTRPQAFLVKIVSLVSTPANFITPIDLTNT